jgi:hypothetical protein
MREETPSLLDSGALMRLCGLDKEQAALELLYRMQELRLVQGLDNPHKLPDGTLEERLPSLIAELAGRNRALLADEQGFYIVSHGFTRALAEELAGLSADIGSLHTRHEAVIGGDLGLSSSAWAITNAGGYSEIGFWPLYVGRYRFVLILSGLPNLNQAATLDLIWLLVRRYGSIGLTAQ